MAEKDDYLVDILVDLGFVSPEKVAELRHEAESAQVGVVDLMLAIQQVIGRTYEPMPLYVLGALMYFAINYSLSLASRQLEARFVYVRE